MKAEDIKVGMIVKCQRFIESERDDLCNEDIDLYESYVGNTYKVKRIYNFTRIYRIELFNNLVLWCPEELEVVNKKKTPLKYEDLIL